MSLLIETQSLKGGGASRASIKMWVLYVLLCADGTLYTGITNDLERRLKIHNSGKGAKYTRSRLPCQLVASWRTKDKSSSLKVEYRFKRLSRQQKLDAIKNGISSLFPEYLHSDENHRDSNRDKGLRIEDRLVKEPPGEERKSEVG